MSSRTNIYVIGYWHKNLGDDLFLKILCDRYRESNFFVVSNDDYDHMCPNLRNRGNRVLNKLLRVVSREHVSLSSCYEYTSDLVIVLGGSIFIESGQPYRKRMKKDSRYYVLGANFGPFYTQEYYAYHKEFFDAAQDVCFREKNSRELFSGLANVRAEADIVFGLERNLSVQSSAKSVVISVMNFVSHPEIDHVRYEQMLLEACREFDRRGCKITLMSFCSFEGDVQAVLSLKEQCHKENIPAGTYLYTGEIDEALSVLEKSEIVLATRYHAAVLGILMGKIVVPLAYSDKTIHVLTDIGFSGEVLDLRDISETDKICVDELIDRGQRADIAAANAPEHPLDTEELRESALRQFMGLDGELLRKRQ